MLLEHARIHAEQRGRSLSRDERGGQCEITRLTLRSTPDEARRAQSSELWPGASATFLRGFAGTLVVLGGSASEDEGPGVARCMLPGIGKDGGLSSSSLSSCSSSSGTVMVILASCSLSDGWSGGAGAVNQDERKDMGAGVRARRRLKGVS